MQKSRLPNYYMLFFALWLGACATNEMVEPLPQAPQIGISGQHSLVWEREVGESAGGQLLITNRGEQTLEFDVLHEGDWLAVVPAGGQLGGQEAQAIEVEATCPEEAGQYGASLEVVSNDAERPAIEVEVTLNCLAIPRGSLEVVVTGLPQGVDADVAISGPEGFEESVTETTLFEDVAIGEYSVAAFSVGDEVIYLPEPAGGRVDVERQGQGVVTIDYSVVTGSVQVQVENLPDPLVPVMALVGGGGDWDIPASGRVDDLVPGLYTVIPEDIDDGGTLYQASERDITVVSGDIAEVVIAYLIDPGALEIKVNGLPAGVNHDIDLVDGEGDVRGVPQSGDLAALEPGSYDVVPREVTVGLATYQAQATTVVVDSGETVEVAIDYQVVYGDLVVTVHGLDGRAANVELVGDQGAFSVTATETFSDLYPGTYEVIVDDVIDGPARFEAPSTAVDVASDSQASVTIEYELIKGQLVVEIAGDLGGATADVVITGPDFSQSISGDQTFSEILPGDYVVVAHDVIDGPATYGGSTGAVTVESGQSTTATATYEVVTGDLPVTIVGLPGGVGADVDLVGSEETYSLTHTQTVRDMLPGTYEVVVHDVEEGLISYEGQGATVVVESGSNDPFMVTYEVVGAELVIEIVGDLGGAAGDVHIAGPEGFTTTMTGDGTVDGLLPGDYTITVRDVVDGDMTYQGTGDVMHTLSSGDSETVVATYELLTSGISVEVTEFGAPDFEVLITGPNNFSEVITASTIFTPVIPGAYAVSVVSLPMDDDGNEGYVTVEPASFSLTSEDTTTVQIVAAEGGIVTHGGDAGPGSLRQVMTSVVDGTVVTIDETVDTIALSSGEIVVDRDLSLLATGQQVNLEADGSRLFTVEAGRFLGLFNLLLSGGSADRGGAILMADGTSTATRTELFAVGSVFENNEATTDGGAIYVSDGAEIVLLRSVFRDNIAGSRGGALGSWGSSAPASSIFIDESLFYGNQAEAGGALLLTGDTVILESTFTDNQASDRGGAIHVLWEHTILEGVTVSGNSAANGGGIFHWSDNVASGSIARSIVAGNSATDGVDIGISLFGDPDNFQSLGYNVVGVAGGDVVDGETGDQAGTVFNPLDAGLLPLAANGGPTRTMALSLASPARSNVPAQACEEISSYDFLRDQRGERRPIGAFCSAGAYEVNGATETFANANMSSNSYDDGSFVGDHGVTWFYDNVRRDTGGYVIEDRSIILWNNPTSRIYTETLSGGVSSVSMQLSKAFTAANDRQVDLYINGDYIASSQAFDEPSGAQTPYPVYRFAVEDIGIDGDFVLEVRSAGAQIVVDNITWE